MSRALEDADIEPWDTAELPLDLRRAFNAYKTVEPQRAARDALFAAATGVPRAAARKDLLWRGTLYAVSVSIIVGSATWWMAREPPRAIEHSAPSVVGVPSRARSEQLGEPRPVASDALRVEPEGEEREGAGASRARELALLERARKVIASEPLLALALTDEHRTRFPEGPSSEEREVLAIEALARAGLRDVAATRARAFRERYPSSTRLVWLDALLQAR